MIVVTVRPDKITVLGHAGYAEQGKDIVCAGVTALSQALLRSMEALTGDLPEYQVSPGAFELNIENLSEKSRILVDSFFIGICEIANDFPEYVRIA